MSEGNGHALRSALWKITTALIVAYVTASFVWIFSLSQRVTSLESATPTRLDSLAERVSALETGRTTPMAAETRAEFNSIWRELGKIKQVIP